MATSAETDEELARRIQQEEWNYLGRGGRNAQNNPSSTAQSQSQVLGAPLLDDNNNADNDEMGNPLLNADDNNAMLMAANDDQAFGNNNNAAQRARRNVLGHVRNADTDSPRILLLRISIALIEMIATATVLSVGWNEGDDSSCGYLKWWLLVYSARHFITIPLRVHIFRGNRLQQRAAAHPVNIDNANNDDEENANNDHQANDAANSNANLSQRLGAEKSIQILRWLSIMTFLLFLLGQTFLFTEKICQYSAPTVWYYCLVIIILVYVSLALPFLIVLAICICLPCVLIIFRFFAEPEGADDRIIKDLPTRKITEDDLSKHKKESLATATATDGDDGHNDDDDEEDEDAPSCAICMQDYKVDDQLRILPCSHEFHTECVDKWLPMKKICPLCRHDVTKKLPSSQQRSSQNNNNNQQNDDNV